MNLGENVQIKDMMYVGRDYERADLRNKDLRGVNFTACNMRGADLSGSDCRGTNFTKADLSRSCLHKTKCQGANFAGADLTGAYMKGTNCTGANFFFAYLKGVVAKDTLFEKADLTGVDVARADFLGARFDGAKTDRMVNLDAAFFYWFIPAGTGRPHYFPFPGAMVLTQSQMGDMTRQENSGLGQARLEYEPALDGFDKAVAE